MVSEFAESFWRNGFVHLSGVFDSAYMDELEAAILRHFGESPELTHERNFLDRAAVEVVPWFPQREGNKQFSVVEETPFVKNLTEAILGSGWGPQFCMIMFSRAGTVGQAWHQDSPPDDAKQFNINRLLYTDDIRPEIGGEVVVVPGSHLMGIIPAGEPHADIEGQLEILPKKGDMLLLHGHCWHRVRNVKSGHRSSINFRAGPAGVPDSITDVCVYRNMKYRFSTASVLEERV